MARWPANVEHYKMTTEELIARLLMEGEWFTGNQVLDHTISATAIMALRSKGLVEPCELQSGSSGGVTRWCVTEKGKELLR